MGRHVACVGAMAVEYRVWRENLRKGDHLQDSGVHGSIILKWIFEKWDGGMDWIDLAQDRDIWQLL